MYELSGEGAMRSRGAEPLIRLLGVKPSENDEAKDLSKRENNKKIILHFRPKNSHYGHLKTRPDGSG